MLCVFVNIVSPLENNKSLFPFLNSRRILLPLSRENVTESVSLFLLVEHAIRPCPFIFSSVLPETRFFFTHNTRTHHSTTSNCCGRYTDVRVIVRFFCHSTPNDLRLLIRSPMDDFVFMPTNRNYIC